MADENQERAPAPFWWPEAPGFIICAILFICAVTVFYRMTNPTVTDDKILDMMITILFSTCLVAIVNNQFGSSRGSAAKDEAISKIATGTGPGGVAAAVTAAAVTAAASAAPAAAAAAAPPAANAAAPPAAEAAAPAAAEKAVAEALAKEHDK